MIQVIRRTLRRVRFGEPIIVVSGLPRSGTSMMMQMLEAGGVAVVTDGMRAADESNPRGYYEVERVMSLEAGVDVAWLAEARGRAVKVIAYLLEHLPPGHNYRVLFMQRSLDEVLASQRAMLERRGESAGPGDERMRELFAGHIARTRRLLAARPEFETLYIRHEHVLADPRAGAAAVASFLRREMDRDAMAAVVDRTLHRSHARS